MLTFIIALAISGAMAVPAPFFHPLVSRQGQVVDPNKIPPQCRSDCQPIMANLQSCAATDPTCACSPTVSTNFQTCLNCFIKVSNNNQAVVTAAQAAGSQLTSACQTAGKPIPPITFAGGSPAGGASSVLVPAGDASTGLVPAGGASTQLAPAGGASSAGLLPSAAGGAGLTSASIPSATDSPLASQSPFPNPTNGPGSSKPSAAAPGTSAHLGLTIITVLLGVLATLL